MSAKRNYTAIQSFTQNGKPVKLGAVVRFKEPCVADTLLRLGLIAPVDGVEYEDDTADQAFEPDDPDSTEGA